MKRHDNASDVEHFDRWASSYDDFWGQRYLDRIHQLMLADVGAYTDKPPRTILDIGCGTGRLLAAAAGCWPAARLLGVDPSAQMAEVARKRLPDASIHVAGAETLPFAEASVDLVMSCVSLHHWNDRAGGLREAARVLSPGGSLCLADIAVPEWVRRLFRNTRAASRAELRSLAIDADFQVEEQRLTMANFVCVVLAVKNPPSRNYSPASILERGSR